MKKTARIAKAQMVITTETRKLISTPAMLKATNAA